MGATGWHRADIIAAIHKKGMSLSRLSVINKLADSTLRAALQKPRTPSNRIIAEFIGVAMHDLWPQWFDRNGQLLVPTDPAKPPTRPASPNRTAA